ncbi:MAG: Imm49 family immunity protein [Pirellulaceae bacterium]
MSSHLLPVFAHNATLELEEHLPNVLNGSASLVEALFCCEQYRIKAIAGLLLTAESELFHWNLHKSARLWSFFLSQLSETVKVSSKSAPFFDGIVCQDLSVSIQIAANSRRTWNSTEEYEDDFLYVNFLMEKFFHEAPDFKQIQIVEQYGQVLDGMEDPRFDVCSAFANHLPIEFESALFHLLDAQETRMNRMRALEVVLPEVAIQATVNVEAAGLCVLARSLGWITPEDVPALPSLIFSPASIDYSDTAWQDPHS